MSIPIVTKARSLSVCLIGKGELCCRYLAGGPEGLLCLKHTVGRIIIDGRQLEGSMNAKGDNCEGLKETKP